MLKQAVTKIRLSYFRNYQNFKCELQPLPVLITGANGTGKTNLLEAISYLSSGKGLRQAKLHELDYKNDIQQECVLSNHISSNCAWAVAAQCQTNMGIIDIGTGRDRERDKRLIRINHAPISSQQILNDHVGCCWLTPQMDHLFLAPPSDRRRFFDRMIAVKTPKFYGYVQQCDKLQRQRMSILINNDGDNHDWLCGIERQIATLSVTITIIREDFLKNIEQIAHNDLHKFPKPHLSLQGDLCDIIPYQSQEQVIAHYCQLLEESRNHDKEKGMMRYNVQRQDIIAFFKEKNIPACQASTGEQKALLIMIILAHTLYLGRHRDILYLLLLDEVVAHLDSHRRGVLLEILNSYHVQYWLTGTDSTNFEFTKSHPIQHFIIDNGQLIES